MTAQQASLVQPPAPTCPGLAGIMQRRLAPPIAFSNAWLEVYSRTTPQSSIGGDLSDLVTRNEDAVAYVTDVSGHGVAAGVLMGMVKTAARYGLMSGQGLPELLGGINRVLPSVKEPSMYATFAGVRVDRAGRMEYSIAGGLPVLHYRESRRKVVRLTMEQFPLGMFHEAQYRSRCVECAPGDLLAVLTDGLVETVNPRDEEFGLPRIEAVLCAFAGRPLQDIYDAVLDAVGHHGEQADDRTLMLVRLPERSGSYCHAS